MSDNLSPAQAEATDVETVEFEHFGKKWHAPAKSRLSHQLILRQDPTNVGIVRAYLSAEELQQLVEDHNPDADELDKFTDDLLEAMGLKGNS